MNVDYGCFLFIAIIYVIIVLIIAAIGTVLRLHFLKQQHFDFSLTTDKSVDKCMDDRNVESIGGLEYRCLKTMSNDLLKLEGCINSIGIETRTGEDLDNFRNFYDILADVAKVIRNNPMLLEDVKIKSFATLDEEVDFLRKYDLSGVECVSHIKE